MRQFVFACLLLATATGHPLVNTTLHGIVHGNAVLDGAVDEFLGLPYTLPPTGLRRFAPPEPLIATAQSFEAGFDATAYGSACVQIPPPTSYPMAEDCLTMNIWRPSTVSQDTRLPVMLWLHGGAFIAGSSRDYNASQLATQGIIVVTVNYRLAALGFLATGPLNNSGTMNGVLDQLCALRWVNANIHQFGGNPSQVTIAGESAGGLSVSFLLHSTEASGLYRAAIIESGSSQACVACEPLSSAAARQVSVQYQLSLKCGSIRCLQNKTVYELTSTGLWFAVKPASADGLLLSGDPFLLPIASSARSVILGFNSLDSVCAPPWDDGSGSGRTPKWPTSRSTYEMDIEAVFGQDDARLVLAMYPVSSGTDHHAVAVQWLSMTSDVAIVCPTMWLADKLETFNRTVHMYDFAFNTNRSWLGLASHGNELPYVFDSEAVGYFPAQKFNQSLAKEMSTTWSSFVKTGTIPESIGWEEWHGGAGRTFGGSTTTGMAPRRDQCSFWWSYLNATSFSGARRDRYRSMVQKCFS